MKTTHNKYMKVTLLLLCLALPASVHATPQTLYQTSFEAPAFTPGLPIRGQDNWQMFHDGEAISIATNNARTGAQCLRFDGSLLEQTGPNYSRAYCFSRALEGATNPAPIVEIRASVRLDGPLTPDQGRAGATLMAAVSTGPDAAAYLGGFIVSSEGRIWNYSQAPGDSFKYSVAYTQATYRVLAVRVDFVARRLTWLVDGTELGSGPIAAHLTADRLYSGYCEMFAQVDSNQTPGINYERTNYTAYFDDYNFISIPLSPVNTVIEFASTNVLADEFRPMASVTVIRRGFTNAAVRVTVSTTNDTAKTGEDYKAVSTFVTFAAGETNKVVEIPLGADDYWAEPDKAFLVRISSLPPGATSPQSTTSVLIRDDERPGSIDWTWSSTLGLPPLAPGEVNYADPKIVARQSDGKLIVYVVVWDRDFLAALFWRILRINADGSPDPTFPEFESQLGPIGARQVVAAPDGKILIVEDLDGRDSRLKYRLNPDGTQDTNFTAMVLGPIQSVVSAPDGKIYVVGGDSLNAMTLNGQRMPRLFRLNNNGTLDSGFTAPTTIFWADLWPQTNGQVLATSSQTQERWANNLYRLNANGTLDVTFQVGAARGFANHIFQLIPQPDGRFLVAGDYETYNGQRRNSIVRVNSNGSIDSSFQSGSGFVDNHSFATNISAGVYLGLLPNGQFLAMGFFDLFNGQPTPQQFVLNPDGTRDREAVVTDQGTLDYYFFGEIYRIEVFFVNGQFYGPRRYFGSSSDNGFPEFILTTNGLGRLRTELPLRIVSTERDGNSTTRLTANALSGRGYTLQVSEDLANWGDLTTQTATTNRIEFTDAPATPPAKRFYRVRQN